MNSTPTSPLGELSGGGVPRTPAEARRSHLESETWRRILVAGIRGLPLWVQRASLPAWAAFFYPQVPAVRRGIRSNLRRLGVARGRLALERRAFAVFARYCESVANAYGYYIAGRLPPRAPVEGARRLHEALAPGRGAVLVTGHVGNWQLGPALLGEDGFPPVTVVMAQEPNAATQRMEEALRDQRVRVVYPSRTPMLALQLRAALERGELVAMQLDRPATGEGIVAPFLGGRARFAAGPALLARTLGVPLVPVFFPLRRDGAVELTVHPPLWCDEGGGSRRERDQRTTERLAALYGEVVRRYPEQWFNFFAFWTDA